MKIIKAGKKLLKERTMQFTCEYCDSILEAEGNCPEFRWVDKYTDELGGMFWVTCPHCKTDIVKNTKLHGDVVFVDEAQE